MGKKIQFDVSDDEFERIGDAKTKAGMAFKTWREYFLSSADIETEIRKMGRKPLTKDEPLTKAELSLALKGIKEMYHRAIDEMELESLPVIEEYAEKLRTEGYPGATLAEAREAAETLRKGHDVIFKGIRGAVDEMSVSAVERVGRAAMKLMLTPPKPPTSDDAYTALTQEGKNLYKEYEEELRKYGIFARHVLKEESKPVGPVRPAFDMELRFKAKQMAGPNTGSVDNIYKKLLAEKE